MLVTLLLFSPNLFAQATVSTKSKNPFPTQYTNDLDKKITIKTVTLAPVYDNLNGIYAKPIQKLLIEFLQNDKVWGYSEFPELEKMIFVEKFDSNPKEVLDVLEKTNSQGLLTAFITKGPRGLTARLKLYTQDQGLLILEESFEDLDAFEISKVRENFAQMYRNLKNRLPYRGYVLSRRGVDITLNVGTLNGIKQGQEISLAQILKLKRHPKLHEIVGVEKEIIAQAKVTKVEDYLCFAQITFEKEAGVVAVGTKILPTAFIAYPLPQLSEEGTVIGDVQAPTTSKIAEKTEAPVVEDFTPHASLKSQKNIFKLQGVFNQFRESSDLVSGTEVSSSTSLAPGLAAGVQAYLTENIFYRLSGSVTNFESRNTLASSTPANIKYTLSQYNGSVGYDYFMEDTGIDPVKLTGSLGLASIKTDVSVTSPTSMTNAQISSILLQFTITIPMGPEFPYTVGASLDYHFSPIYSETPVNSGNAKATITSLGLFGRYPLTDSLNLRADLNYMTVSTSFSGTATRSNPARSNSMQLLDEKIGIEYLF